MQCPNCRKIEKGQWLYANGSRSFPEISMDDWVHDEDLYDLSYSEMVKIFEFLLKSLFFLLLLFLLGDSVLKPMSKFVYHGLPYTHVTTFSLLVESNSLVPHFALFSISSYYYIISFISYAFIWQRNF